MQAAPRTTMNRPARLTAPGLRRDYARRLARARHDVRRILARLRNGVGLIP